MVYRTISVLCIGLARLNRPCYLSLTFFNTIAATNHLLLGYNLQHSLQASLLLSALFMGTSRQYSTTQLTGTASETCRCYPVPCCYAAANAAMCCGCMAAFYVRAGWRVRHGAHVRARVTNFDRTATVPGGQYFYLRPPKPVPQYRLPYSAVSITLPPLYLSAGGRALAAA